MTAPSSRSVPSRIAVSDRVQAELAGRVYRLCFPPGPATTACVRLAPGVRWDGKRQVWLMSASDVERVRGLLRCIDLALGSAHRTAVEDEDEPRILVRDGEASVGQRILSPHG